MWSERRGPLHRGVSVSCFTGWSERDSSHGGDVECGPPRGAERGLDMWDREVVFTDGIGGFLSQFYPPVKGLMGFVSQFHHSVKGISTIHPLSRGTSRNLPPL